MHLSLSLSLSLSQEEVKAEIEKFCSALGSLEAECKTVVDMFFDEIWDLIEKELVCV